MGVLDPGRMDRRIRIESRTDGQDAAGAPVPAWSHLATVWAEVRPERGGEALDGDRILATEAALFRVRYLSALNVRCRLLYGGKTWDITGISEMGRQEGQEISATARVS